MAYLAFTELAPAAAPFANTVARIRPSFSPLEWSVIALARSDRLSTLREPGRISVAMGTLFGDRPNPRLADPKLEALRRMAVLTWHHGYTVPNSELCAFYAAGFDPAQYELMVDSIAADRRTDARTA